jgi:hypothetical protein
MALYRVPVDVTWTGGGSPGVNVWSLRIVGADESAAVNDALDALATFYTATLQTYGAAGTRWTIGQGITNRDTQADISEPVRTGVAGGTEDDLPASTQLVVSWRTSLRARRGMGRTFLGPLANSARDLNGTPNDGMLAGVRSAAAALIQDSSLPFGWAFGVYGLESEWDGWPAPPPENTPRVHRDFTSAVVKDKFAVLRSRRD